ncbi:cyclic peptide export ABC transporter [Lysinibacillus xylanilyticus]|uniref:cyclic peptide export ABC transporter n=1 Tax=Lysinibacillus xylanilyticus TaxID=582475 RepID=UPI0038085044
MERVVKIILIFIIFNAFNTTKIYAEDLLNEEKLKEVEELFYSRVKEANIPGASLSIVKGSTTILNVNSGYSNLNTQKKVNSDTYFELGSNSKAFTGLAILKLKYDSLLDLDDSVSKFIPNFYMIYEGERISPTIRQLLEHRSGIPFNSIATIPVSTDADALEKNVNNLIGKALASYPGKKYEYATINYSVLGLVIEKITNMSFEEFIRQEIFKPLNLGDYTPFREGVREERISVGYKVNLLKPREFVAPIYKGNNPAGYVVANSKILTEWMKVQLGFYDDNIENSLKQALLHQTESENKFSDEITYKNGWFIARGGKEIFHPGNNPNYSSFIIVDKEEKIGISIVSNINTLHTELIAREVMDVIRSEQYSSEGSDLNDQSDFYSLLIILLLVVVNLLLLYFFINILKNIKLKNIFSKKITYSIIVKILLAFVIAIVVSLLINQIPTILLGGLTWEFIQVWLPNTVTWVYYFLIFTIWYACIVYILNVIFKQKNKNKNTKKQLYFIALLSIISGGGNALIIFSVNMAITSDDKKMAISLFVLGTFLYLVFQRITRVRLVEITNNMMYSKRMSIVHKILKISYEDFEKIERGRIHSTLNNDTEIVSRFINIIITCITSFVTLIVCLIYLGFISLLGLLITLVIILTITTIYYLTGTYANKIGERARDLQNSFFRFIDDIAKGFKELKLNELRRKEFEEDMESFSNQYKVMKKKANVALANVFVIGESLFIIAIGGIVFLLPVLLLDLNNENIIKYIFVLLYMIGPVHGILDSIPALIDVKISWKRIKTFTDELKEIKSSDKTNEDIPVNDDLILELKNVEYNYNSSLGEQAFKVGPINYQFKSGEVSFITGGNGSGKSTLAKLVTGLYERSEGSILINGQEVNATVLNKYCSAIFSDFHLFEKLYGISSLTQEHEANQLIKLMKLENKIVFEDGKVSTLNLSTGQKKRLALIISYLEDKPIYVFDEWAADQDPEFRSYFYNVLLPELKLKGKCIIAITHDEHYFNSADKILKMKLT